MASEKTMQSASSPAVLPPDADWAAVREWRKQTRAALIQQRTGISASDRAAWSDNISRALLEALDSSNATIIGVYWPFRGEYDPREVMANLRDRGTRLALPVIVERGQPLVFREWQPGSLMTQGVWNVPMPESGQAVMPDLLVVPFVGFDAKGYRLGYGGGFYDRTIAAMPAKPRTIGVGFKLGRLETIYPQPHDIALERIITE
ncbi:5-formyltetrahydrofolate cyclo-ligase [Methylobacterium iners]|uniref:5-formyltetrahydrofolate cyclo-ligase n=1 Tax=Methylobacterium iners TaxID=418707 RepID=A0ABQ4RS61_9HYPH|nr:5-formyltetrahydrofolate cyclo-ligase [Methylobacterium iners]GJD93623.1 5-formyltetrahydrofolate cyclo-ligase [Methylobacterium iners]